MSDNFSMQKEERRQRRVVDGTFRVTLSGLYPYEAKRMRKEIPGADVRKVEGLKNGTCKYTVKIKYGTESFKNLIEILCRYATSEAEHQAFGGGWMEP